MSKWYPGRRLSWWRLSIVLAVCVGLTAGAWFAWGTWEDQREAEARQSWVGGYVDVTATPTYDFEQRGPNDDRNIVLSFIVGDPERACVPSWGGYYGMNEAQAALDLDRRLARFRALGGSAMVSFGGAANSDLAVACTDPKKLASAYASVVERYGARAIDMDIEGDLLRNSSALRRQAAAIADLQATRAEDRTVDVWLTLPVTVEGLDVAGQDVVRIYLDAGVRLAGVNAMTMNYNDALTRSMTSKVRSSLSGLHTQLRSLYAEHDIALGTATAWAMVAATPMIGQNDVREEVFTLDDAAALSRFANAQGIARLSYWSSNRDRSCDPNWPDPRVVSSSCSGVVQDERGFLAALSAGRTDEIAQAAEPPAPDPDANLADDPATSPYPIWVEGASYPAGTKIVWRRNVYEAKWWTEGEQPDAPAQEGSVSPWRLIGPVLEGETPIERPTLPKGTYPDWKPSATYERGDRVMAGEQTYEAKWWTRGDSPEAALVRPQDSPWRLLNDSEIEDVLAKLATERSSSDE